ncbi:protein phosphatase 1 regulatory subunit 3E [Hyperolius riggenbachi]|uniref:protein phosphatase 1 regulatory subunit 3E n=1 Tax=Hyperolius riggenbachi TaxID=752182 RepID=UPI0035A3A40E
MSCRSRPPTGDIPRNLSYIAGLYERAYYRTARPSLEEHEEEEEEAKSSQGLSTPVKSERTPRRRSRSAPTLRVPREERHRSPETRKRVRFADALGLELESVRHFRRDDVPCIPQHVTFRLQKELLKQLGGSCRSKEDVSWCEARHVISPSWTVEGGTWEKQTWERSAWDQETWDQRVCLQSMRCESCFLWGSIRVLDLAYEKRVIVRYSQDEWLSYQDTHALYAARLCHGGAGHPGTDLFTFRLPLPTQDQPQPSSLQFAICYQVEDEEFWDNNKGRNYSLKLAQAAQASRTQDSENGWIHFI